VISANPLFSKITINYNNLYNLYNYNNLLISINLYNYNNLLISINLYNYNNLYNPR
jgi:hypothetical protein